MTPAKKILPDIGTDLSAARPEQPLSALEAATFIEGMVTELRHIARAAKLDTLSYFLEMARIESAAQIETISERKRAT